MTRLSPRLSVAPLNAVRSTAGTGLAGRAEGELLVALQRHVGEDKPPHQQAGVEQEIEDGARS